MNILTAGGCRTSSTPSMPRRPAWCTTRAAWSARSTTPAASARPSFTAMARLARKHLLRAEKVDQAYVYYPTLTQEQFVSHFVGRILENLLVSFAGATLEGLDRLSDPEAAERARRVLGEITRRRAAEESE